MLFNLSNLINKSCKSTPSMLINIGCVSRIAQYKICPSQHVRYIPASEPRERRKGNPNQEFNCQRIFVHHTVRTHLVRYCPSCWLYIFIYHTIRTHLVGNCPSCWPFYYFIFRNAESKRWTLSSSSMYGPKNAQRELGRALP